MQAQEIIKKSRELILDMKGENLRVLDLTGLSMVCDYFVLASGNSQPHIKALAECLDMGLKKDGLLCYRKSGDPESGWMILDYFDVVVHIMSEEAREYYQLEALWSDAEEVSFAG